jgi:hypothetical protein
MDEAHVVPAGVIGTIADVCVGNGDFVEFGQPLSIAGDILAFVRKSQRRISYQESNGDAVNKLKFVDQ